MSMVPLYALAGASALTGAAGHMKAGNAAARTAEYNAKIAERNAKVYEQQAEMRLFSQDLDDLKFVKQAGRFLDTVGVAYEKANVKGKTGTPLKVQMESAAQADEELAMRDYNARVDALALREQGTNMQLTANLTRMEGQAQKRASRIQAFGSLLGNAQQAAYMWKFA
tara:strand:- start:2826 stop:3329 length:504 start_codon:yes stop_codon:yes gene_type:complete